jgi:hypothetical protein
MSNGTRRICLKKPVSTNLVTLSPSGAYRLDNTPPPTPQGGGRNISRCHLGENYTKVEEKKEKNVDEKGKNGREREN